MKKPRNILLIQFTDLFNNTGYQQFNENVNSTYNILQPRINGHEEQYITISDLLLICNSYINNIDKGNILIQEVIVNIKEYVDQYDQLILVQMY